MYCRPQWQQLTRQLGHCGYLAYNAAVMQTTQDCYLLWNLKMEDLNQGGWIFAWPQCQWKYILSYMLWNTDIYMYIYIYYNIWYIYIHLLYHIRWYTYNIQYIWYKFLDLWFSILFRKMAPNHCETWSCCVAQASLNSQTFHAPLCRPFLIPRTQTTPANDSTDGQCRYPDWCPDSYQRNSVSRWCTVVYHWGTRKGAALRSPKRTSLQPILGG